MSADLGTNLGSATLLSLMKYNYHTNKWNDNIFNKLGFFNQLSQM